jgi:hypothetical protein
MIFIVGIFKYNFDRKFNRMRLSIMNCTYTYVLVLYMHMDSGADHSGRAVFALSNTGIVGSNPTQGMDVYVYSVFVLSCV